MDEQEIIRRLKAIIAMDRYKRPISIDRLEKIAGVAEKEVYAICREPRKMLEKTRAKLSRALELVENNQVVVQKTPNRPTKVSIRPPQPPHAVVQRVHFTDKGPKIQFLNINPYAFPEIPPAYSELDLLKRRE